ncbi:MAG: PTS transporter subunit EIIC, partial [Holdemania filiformis]
FPVGLLILGPIGAVLGEGLMQIFAAIDASVPFLVPMIVGAVSPFLVFVGMHRAVGTLETMQIAQMGSSSLLGTGMLASNIAQGASTLVLSLKSKDEKVKPLAFTAGVTALCGITEPALYGFTAKNKKSLIATVIGGGVGGFYAGITHVVRFAKGAPGLPTLPVFISLDNPMNLINACITVLIAFAVAFIAAWVMIKPEEIQ